MKKKTAVYWIVAIVITLAAVVFQRRTGPTNPERASFMLEGTEYRTKLPRSLTNKGECSTLKFNIKHLPEDIHIDVFTRKFKSNDKWVLLTPQREGEDFALQLPSMPAAAKIEYYLLFTKPGSDMIISQETPVVARFKDNVPAVILIPHIVLMFAAMLFSNLSGLLAFFRRERYRGYAKIALACLLVGGFILGCLVQKAAFGHYWSGFPFGGDLTDNKTLFALVAWIFAIAANWRSNKHPLWIAVAALFMLFVYCIPHSTLGSEYNYNTGQVETEGERIYTP